MIEFGRLPRGWVNFAGGVLVVAVLYWAQPIIVPLVVAILLTFVLTPVVIPLQRVVGRVVAVLAVVMVTFGTLGFAGWAVTRQVTGVVQELPRYRDNIRQKVRDIRAAGRGGSVATLQETVADIHHEIDKGVPGTPALPIAVESSHVTGLWGFPAVIAAWFEPFANVGLVVVLVIFMLLERQQLRNRLIKLLGYGKLAVTTRALDEAGQRVSRYLLRQSLINLVFGLAVGISLYAIGVPYAVLWGTLAGALRFIPFIGPWISALAPLVVSLAVFEGWTRPLAVIAAFVVLELIANVVLEPYFYADAAGISQVGLLTAIAFWTWLWGPLGLLMATPITVCIVVIGKYAPGLEFLSTLLADDPELEIDGTYYQRLLAGDRVEAAEIIAHYVEEHGVESVYDTVMLPTLNYAERDRLEGRLSREEEDELVHATCDLLAEVAETHGNNATTDDAPTTALTVLGYPGEGEADVVALRMLAQALPASLTLQVLPDVMLSSDLIGLIRAEGYRVVCIADLPPSTSTKSRYLVKRLRAALPDVKLVVGRWGPESFADDGADALLGAGADAVTQRLVDARDVLVGIQSALPKEAAVA